MTPSSPVVAQIEFSSRIRKRRHELGLDAKTISSHLKFSRNFWSAIENNRAILSREKLEVLAEILNFGAAEKAELIQLLQASKGIGWWDEYSSIANDDALRFFGLEYGASSLAVFDSQVVTGLLQTEAYARALISAYPTSSLATLKQAVELRLRRQERLMGDDPPQTTIVLGQAATMQQIGGRSVLQDQLEHLIRLVERLTGVLDLRIQPFEANTPGLMSASVMVLLGFDSEHVPTVVWREAGPDLAIADDPDLVEFLHIGFEQVMASSLDGQQTLDLLHDRVKELN